MLPPPVHEPEAVRGMAEDILADSRYDQPETLLIDRILGWFGEQIEAVLGSFLGSGAGGLVAWALVIAAVAFVVYLVIRHGRVGQIRRPARPQAEVMVELTRTPREWRAEADALEAGGRWREGLRCRHRALVAELVRRDVVGDQAGRTAGEHVRDVARRLPDAAPAMAAATELFEAAWYGGATTGPAEAARFAELHHQVLDGRVAVR